jgi:hypothetical protein
LLPFRANLKNITPVASELEMETSNSFLFKRNEHLLTKGDGLQTA